MEVMKDGEKRNVDSNEYRSSEDGISIFSDGVIIAVFIL